MKTRTICILVITTLLTVTHSLYAQGTAFSYQGHVFDNGTNFTGAGLFKFALVTSTNTATRVTAGNLAGTLPASQLSGTLGNGQLANSSITVNAGTGLTGGGTVALGGSLTLNATGSGGVVSVTGNADITATTVSGAVTLGDTATSLNTAGTLVKRDGSGNFSAGTISAASFTGNGAGLTNLNGANLTAGSVGTTQLAGGALAAPVSVAATNTTGDIKNVKNSHPT